MEQDNCFEEKSPNDAIQTMCQSPATEFNSLTDEIDVATNNHDLQSMEHNKCLEALDLNKEQNTISTSPSTLLENRTEETAFESDSHNNESMASKSYLKEKCSESDSLISSNIAAPDKDLEDEVRIPTSNDTSDTDNESYLKENCSKSSSLTCSNDAGLDEKLQYEIGINSNTTIQDLETETYLKEKCPESESLTSDAALDENSLEDEIGITHTASNSTIVNDESYTEDEEDVTSIPLKEKRKRDRINQSLSLPYYKMSRPDFHEFTNNVAKNLEVPMKGLLENNEEPKVIKELFFRKGGYSMPPLNLKHQKQILPLQQFQYQKKCFGEKNIAGDKEHADIVLCEGSAASKKVPSSCSKTIKESCRLRREDLIQRLKDEMQKKKEAAFDRHKEIQDADEEICDSDAEEFDKVLDYEDSRSPTPSNSNEDSLAKRNPVSDSEDSCILPEEKEVFESAVEFISNEATHDSRSSDEENYIEKYDASEGFMDSPPVSLSIPSYQPNGGFTVESDASSDSCNSDSEKAPPSDTNISSQSLSIRNSFDLDASQMTSFGLDEVSTICSGRFLSMDEERPWTPSDSQMSRKEDLDIRSNDGECQMSREELEPDNSQLKELYDVNGHVGIVSKRKNSDNYTEETFSPPSKKYKNDFIPDESSRIPSSLKIDEIMQDVYEKSSVNVDNLSQNLCINYHTSNELTDCIDEQETSETIDDEDNEEIQRVPRIRKCRPLIDDSDDDDGDETNVSENQDIIEALPPTEIDDNLGPLKINDFLEEEAELSGDEMSSDESDGDYGDDEAELGLLPEDLPAEDELKEQVANIHFKHECDDDARIVKRLQQDFLPEGELHFDGSGRQKTFHWSNNVSSNIQNEILSESEPEDNIESPMIQDKIKWRQETSVTQKCSDGDSSDAEGEEKTPNFKKLPVSIVGRALSCQPVSGANKHTTSSPFTRRHGSLIHVAGSEGLNLNVSSSVQRKTVLFQALSRSDKVNSSTSQAFDGKSVFEKLL